MNAGMKETEGYFRPAFHRWNDGFAGASRDPDYRIVSCVAGATKKCLTHSMSAWALS
jgi:hypothetical protein